MPGKPKLEDGYYQRAKGDIDGPTCIDLFAGAGGLAEGLKQAGFVILSGVDSDGSAARTFRHNFPTASFFHRAVESVTTDELLDDAGLGVGELDCLVGGPPCQSFSYNNHLRSNAGARALLFRHYLRVVKHLQPRTLLMENVPGILTVANGSVILEILSSLRKLGYSVEARILFAEEYGVPQERRRVFIVGTREGNAGDLFPDGVMGPVARPANQNPWLHYWHRREARSYLHPRSVSVWAAIGDLPRLANGEGAETSAYGRSPRTLLQRRLRGGQNELFNHLTNALHALTLERISHVPEGGSWRDIPFDLLPAGMKRAKKSDHTKRYGRLAKGGRCCTLLTKCDPHWGSYVHPQENRTISVREAARLQSFPDHFRFFGNKGEQYSLVGNAVPVFMAKALGQSLLSRTASPAG